jgi:hypothetical protein
MTFKIINILKFNNDRFKFNSDFKCHIIFEMIHLIYIIVLIRTVKLLGEIRINLSWLAFFQKKKKKF